MSRRPGSLSRRAVLKTAGAAGALAAAPHFGRHLSASAQDATPVSGGTLTYGSGKPTYNILTPVNTISTSQNVVIEATFQRLVYGRQWGDGINPDSNQTEIELGIAASMTEITPNQVWEFEVRDNALWHDGTPVTVDDVIFGIWISLNKNAGTFNETPASGIKGGARLQEEGAAVGDIMVEGATKIGDRGVRIELEAPVPNYWVNWNVGYWPYPKHIFGEMPFEQLFDPPYATMPIGNGPFKVTNFVDGQYIEMEAFDDFYLGRPLLDKYIIRFGDGETLTAALESGEIDGCGLSPGAVFQRLTDLDHIVGNAVPRDHPDGFAVNRERFPGEIGTALSKAIMYALDVPLLNEQLYNGTLRPSNYLFEHVVGLETPPEGFPTYGYDPEAARALLEEAGWDFNRTLEWQVSAVPSPGQEAMAAMLSAAGIQTQFLQIDPASVVEELYTQGNFDLTFANFGAYQTMRDNWQYLKCGWTRDLGGANYARYCNEEVDALWQTALDEPDFAKAKPLWDETSLALSADPPQSTVYRQSILYGWNQRVQGAFPYQYRLPVRAPFERVWIAPEE
ncbi:MAG: ABC transporter substrate-binding protein [Thermomicrobiales bacterium]|nr:ABC transporter substrate-binding protein [Thermomicrobiales bacterium]